MTVALQAWASRPYPVATAAALILAPLLSGCAASLPPGHTDGCLTFVMDDRSMAFTGDVRGQMRASDLRLGLGRSDTCLH